MKPIGADISYTGAAYAINMHESINHLYDDYLPYRFHLEMAVQVAREFIHLIPELDRDIVYAAVWNHDWEDTPDSYNDMRKAMENYFSKGIATHVAEIVYALGDLKGRNRKERHSELYWAGIRAVRFADFVKLCDRIANVRYGKMMGGRMYELYKKEHKEFVEQLGEESVKRYGPMFQVLDKLFGYAE